MPEEKTQAKETNDILTKVVEKVENASNILVTVSKNPTADELSAAIGLTMMLDGIGKHATAIYSGDSPEKLQFLEPDKTFENNTNSLQDFIIALNKDKADHLRYKVDGEFVKVFITPYKTTLDEGDLEFSHGDYNVDLVIALGVQTTDDLDAALYEHSKIMHDAGSINITDKEPGQFAEIEWNDPSRSSVSEMVSDLAYAMKDKIKMTKPVATALLTGIIAETDRFSNDDTTPRTMDVAAKLMQAGANQKQIAENLEVAEKKEEEEDSNELDVHGEDEDDFDAKKIDEALDLDKLADEAAGPAAADGGLTPEEQLDQLVNQPANSALDELQKAVGEIYSNPQDDVDGMNKGDVIPEPAEAVVPQPKDYGQMMEDALAEPLPNPAAQMTPEAPTGPELNHIPNMEYVPHAQTTPVTVPEMGENYLTAAPAVNEVAVPQPMSPVPQPVVDPATQFTAEPQAFEAPAPVAEPVTAPVVEPVPVPQPEIPVPQPVLQPEIPVPQPVSGPVPVPQPMPQPDLTASQLEQANDPGAFRIPGM